MPSEALHTKTIIRADRWLVPCSYRRKVRVGAARRYQRAQRICQQPSPGSFQRTTPPTDDTLLTRCTPLGEIPVRTVCAVVVVTQVINCTTQIRNLLDTRESQQPICKVAKTIETSRPYPWSLDFSKQPQASGGGELTGINLASPLSW